MLATWHAARDASDQVPRPADLTDGIGQSEREQDQVAGGERESKDHAGREHEALDNHGPHWGADILERKGSTGGDDRGRLSNESKRQGRQCHRHQLRALWGSHFSERHRLRQGFGEYDIGDGRWDRKEGGEPERVEKLVPKRRRAPAWFRRDRVGRPCSPRESPRSPSGGSGSCRRA